MIHIFEHSSFSSTTNSTLSEANFIKVNIPTDHDLAYSRYFEHLAHGRQKNLNAAKNTEI